MEQRGEAQVLPRPARHQPGSGPRASPGTGAGRRPHGARPGQPLVVWDDLGVDWGRPRWSPRSTWDYDGRRGEFLGWASGVGPALLNGVSVFRWNTDKRYLIDLQQAGLPIVPTVTADTVFDARRRGQVRARRGQAAGRRARPGPGGRRGRQGVAAAGGRPPGPVGGAAAGRLHPPRRRDVGVRDRRPARQPGAEDAEPPRHPRTRSNGGTSRSVELTEKAASLAASAVATVVDLLGEEIVYARVDMMRYRDQLVVSEVELTEPGLYLDVLPLNALPFAEAVAARAYPRTW